MGDGAIDVKGTPADMPSDTIDELIYQLLQTFAHVSAGGPGADSGSPPNWPAAGRVPWGAVLRRRRPSGCFERLQEAGDPLFLAAGKPILAEITLDELRAKLR